jgi:dihydroorotate dehydrogenase
MNLEVKIGELTFKNPIIVGSAGYAEDANGIKRFIERGYAGIVTKSTARKELVGAPPPRVFWLDKYRRNWIDGSEGHRNPGVEKMAEEIKKCKSFAEKENCHIIGSITCMSVDEAVFVAKEFEKAGVSALEVDMVCPNVGEQLGPEYATRGGEYWSDPKHPERAIELIKAIKSNVSIPLWCKISPKTLFLVGEKISNEVPPGAFSYIGSGFPSFPLGLAIDIDTGEPLFSGNILLRIKKNMKFVPYATIYPLLPTTVLVTALLRKKIDIPLIPSGGISNGFDIIQCLMAGANAVQICTAVYKDLNIIEKMLREIGWFMAKKGYTDIKEIIGITLDKIPFELMEIPIRE